MKLQVSVQLSPAQLAEAFCDLDDEGQAQFFIDAAAIAAKWETPSMQWYLVGKHLRTCACSTYEAREMVREIAESIEISDEAQA